MTGHDLGRATTEESRRLGAVLLVPLGSTEQHGPHLPLDTDTRVALGWARALAPRIEATVAPPLPYGSAGEHQDFAGTLSIGREALESVLVELIRSASSTFDRLVLLSGHAGNAEPVDRVVKRMTHEGHQVLGLFPRWPIGDSRFPKLDAHAGRVETSLMLHLDPDLVRIEHAVPGATEPLDELMDDMRRGGVAAVAPNGVLGDPTGSSAFEGRALFDDLVDRSEAQIRTWLGQSG